MVEWSWNRLDPDRGWYPRRSEGAVDDLIFMFAYNSIELDVCGTETPVPHASLHIVGQSGLVMEWRVQAIGPAGLRRLVTALVTAMLTLCLHV
jgi:hypothetical protein